MERVARIELANIPWQGIRLPLHHTRIKTWSEYKDSNLGPSAPKADALPGCATLRIIFNLLTTQTLDLLILPLATGTQWNTQ